MNYIEYIETTKSWTCPKSGPWKIIAVGGGAGGGFMTKGGKIVQPTGGSTSFGNLLTAKGGQQGRPLNPLGIMKENVNISVEYTKIAENAINCELDTYKNFCASGYGGFDGVSYGGLGSASTFDTSNSSYKVGAIIESSTLNGGRNGITNPAYGSGGGFTDENFRYWNYETQWWYMRSKRYPIGGYAGQMKILIADLVLNQQYQCTIGKGGDVTKEITAAKITQIDPTETMVAAKKSGLVLYDITAEHSGRDGVIILQYMGV